MLSYINSTKLGTGACQESPDSYHIKRDSQDTLFEPQVPIIDTFVDV